jgi:uncharacterized protein Smg (DUF494 family)
MYRHLSLCSEVHGFVQLLNTNKIFYLSAQVRSIIIDRMLAILMVDKQIEYVSRTLMMRIYKIPEVLGVTGTCYIKK